MSKGTVFLFYKIIRKKAGGCLNLRSWITREGIPSKRERRYLSIEFLEIKVKGVSA